MSEEIPALIEDARKWNAEERAKEQREELEKFVGDPQ
jgi:hypothetical protein